MVPEWWTCGRTLSWCTQLFQESSTAEVAESGFPRVGHWRWKSGVEKEAQRPCRVPGGDLRWGATTKSASGDERKGVRSSSRGLKSLLTWRLAESRCSLTRVPPSHQGNAGGSVAGLNENFQRLNLKNRWLIPCLTGA